MVTPLAWTVTHVMGNTQVPEPGKYPWQLPALDLMLALGTTRAGLTDREVARRLRLHGSNLLRQKKARHWGAILGAQFKSLIVFLLATASVVSFAFGKAVEAVAIGAVIVLNAAIGFLMELKATRSMEALGRLGQATATVRRNDELSKVPAASLVPGDVVVFEAGDMVTTDVRLIEANKMQVNESALTGESLPVSKTASVLPDSQLPLGERRNLLFKGTVITRGSGEGVVYATGGSTEIGQISRLVEEAEDEITPLEQRLNRLGRRLLWLTLVIALWVLVSGLLAGQEPLLLIESAIALAVATVPEGLPIVATLALARGMWRMARKNALLRRLSAVETLGSTSVILTDKTGTLTENQITVRQILVSDREYDVCGSPHGANGRFVSNGATVEPASEPLLLGTLRAAVLCNNAELPSNSAPEGPHGVGDPLEVALLVAGVKAGLSQDQLRRSFPEIGEEAFDPETRMMATVHANGARLTVVKGAPEAVFEHCTEVETSTGRARFDDCRRSEWTRRNSRLAARGLRVLALAEKTALAPDEKPYSRLTLLGLVAMLDPPRQEVRQVVAACREAGVRIVMVTGDQAATAGHIAREVGLSMDGDGGVVSGPELGDEARVLQATVLARTSPKQKLDVIRAHQRAGHIVAMVGDGVNDAPALKQAEIGVAMGRHGTQVAQEASEMVLRDDSLGTVVVAIREGRIIFDNVRKFVVYLLSCNISELLAVGISPLVGLPLPVLPLQILFLNLVTDVFPALALAACEGEANIMQRPPRPAHEAVLERKHWHAIVRYGVLLTASVVGSLCIAHFVLGSSRLEAITISYLTLGLAQTWHVFNIRATNAPAFANEVSKNPWVWGAVVICVTLLLATVYLPGLSDVLQTEPPTKAGWFLILASSALPLAITQLLGAFRGVRRAPEIAAQ